MTNASETVREVCAEMNYCKATSYSSGGCNDCNNFDCRDVRRFADRILSAYEREMASKDEEIEHGLEDFFSMRNKYEEAEARIELLERALKPVMECDMSVRGYGVRIENAVREAQRIILEAWDDKNYFWKDNKKGE